MIQWMMLLDSLNYIFIARDFQRTPALSEVSIIVWLTMYDIKVYISSLGNLSISQRQLRFLSKYMDNLTSNIIISNCKSLSCTVCHHTFSSLGLATEI